MHLKCFFCIVKWERVIKSALSLHLIVSFWPPNLTQLLMFPQKYFGSNIFIFNTSDLGSFVQKISFSDNLSLFVPSKQLNNWQSYEIFRSAWIIGLKIRICWPIIRVQYLSIFDPCCTPISHLWPCISHQTCNCAPQSQKLSLYSDTSRAWRRVWLRANPFLPNIDLSFGSDEKSFIAVVTLVCSFNLISRLL